MGWGLVVRFLVLLVLLNGFYIAEKRLSGRFLDLPYTSLVTWTAARAGEALLSIPVIQRGPITLGSDYAAVVIRAGCNGLEVVFLLLAGLLAFPASWQQRGRALILYLPLLFVFNVFRVLMLLFVMTKYPAHIDLFHYQIGQGIMVILVMTFWVHYVHKADS